MSSLPKLPAHALPLADAVREFVPRDLWNGYEQAAQKYDPRSVRLIWADYAARLNRSGRDPRVAQVRSERAERDLAWQSIEHALVKRLIAGDLILYAQSNPPFGEWRALPPESCRGLRIKNLRSGRVKGLSFELTGVHVGKADSGNVQPVPTLSGSPGRPSSMGLVKAEFDRRVAAGDIESSLEKQGKTLEAWLERTHPDAPRCTAKTITNKIRAAYKRARDSGHR